MDEPLGHFERLVRITKTKFMKLILTVGAVIVLSVSATAQDGTVKDLKSSTEKTIKKDDKDTVVKTWKTGGSFALNVNQGTLSNWSAGGDKFSFSLNAYSNLYAFYKKDKHSWDNTLDLAYGVVNTTSLGNRKASDRIDLLSKYGYAITPKMNIAGLVNLRSQFAKGYTYTKNTAGLDSASLTSKTFAPAYLLLSVGLDYKPAPELSLFISPATARWVFVGDNTIKELYSVPLNKSSRQEFGAFASVNYLKTFAKNLTFKSKLDLFSNYKSNPQNIDIFWSNVLTAKITRYINFSLNVDMIYDDDVENVNPAKGPAPQILQLMGIGFAYSFRK